MDSSEMPPRDVYLYRPEFTAFPYDNFRTNLNNLRKAIAKLQDSALWDSQALARDRKLFPRPDKNFRGEPQWHGSDAEALLKQDVTDGKQKTMKPKDLYKSRNEYQVYPLHIFRGHIDQEERAQKHVAQWYKKKKR